MERLAWIALAGAAGTLARYGVSLLCQERLGPDFPWGTLVVNVLGSFLIAAIMQWALSSESVSETTRLALTTGLMGGFTTYSAFNYETTALFQQGAWKTGVVNVAVTLVGGLVAGLAGALLVRRWIS